MFSQFESKFIYPVLSFFSSGIGPYWPSSKSQISNVGHDGILSIRNYILMVNKLKNPNFERLSSIGPYWPSSGQGPKIQM
jgi:hypothetical protein